jgi:hypothetical protein
MLRVFYLECGLRQAQADTRQAQAHASTGSCFDKLMLRQAHASTGSCFDKLMLRQAHASTSSCFDKLMLRQAQHDCKLPTDTCYLHD